MRSIFKERTEDFIAFLQNERYYLHTHKSLAIKSYGYLFYQWTITYILYDHACNRYNNRHVGENYDKESQCIGESEDVEMDCKILEWYPIEFKRKGTRKIWWL